MTRRGVREALRSKFIDGLHNKATRYIRPIYDGQGLVFIHWRARSIVKTFRT